MTTKGYNPHRRQSLCVTTVRVCSADGWPVLVSNQLYPWWLIGAAILTSEGAFAAPRQ
jgi:hypothetical protein